MNDDKDTPFLARWSRRKAQVREGKPVAEADAALHAPPVADQQPLAAEPAPAATSPAAPAEPPPPTLADVDQLDARTGDFTRFVRPSVQPEVKNAALKKLFHADPHFNVMDGLDVYIDDYNKPDPLPASMLRKMAQAQFLGLFTEDEAKDKDTAGTPASPDDQDLDLRLQPDDAARRPGPEPGPGPDADGQH
jgi:hypothetical protein